jgi:hypothetical protein
MLFGYFTLFVALMISAVAEFYSIVGLTTIFSAAFWPVVIMGACLGVGKITAAVWLKLNWERANWTYKLYLVPAVAFLMLLTSMGIFGYLSKAHSDQSLVSGDSMAKVAIYDEKIKTAKDNIDANRKALKQMDEAVDQVMGRSSDEKGAEKAVGIRRSQQKERQRLQSEIATEQKAIAAISEERAPLAAEFRKIESEVGPIKYIAALVYGDNPDANILEKAVRLVIILIVAVFDPLALVLILAAQQSLRWSREEREETRDEEQFIKDAVQELQDDIDLQETKVEEHKKSIFETHPYLLNPFSHFRGTTPIVAAPAVQEQPVPETYPVEQDYSYIDQDNKKLQEEIVQQEQPKILAMGIDEVERPGDYVTPPDHDDEEDPAVKAAMKLWKEQNPDDTLKNQRHKLIRGEIDQLPWLKLVADNELPEFGNSGFGIEFPTNAKKGDTFVRVDQYPNAVYKYNGHDWIQVDKNLTDSYTYDSAYIDHLIAKISSGEYDPDMLSDSESEQVAERLQQNSNPNA